MRKAIDPNAKEKPCPRCKIVKPTTLEHWTRNRHSPDGLSAACKSCNNIANRARSKKKRLVFPKGRQVFHRLSLDERFCGFSLDIKPETGKGVTFYRSAESDNWSEARVSHDDAIKIGMPASFVGGGKRR